MLISIFWIHLYQFYFILVQLFIPCLYNPLIFFYFSKIYHLVEKRCGFFPRKKTRNNTKKIHIL